MNIYRERISRIPITNGMVRVWREEALDAEPAVREWDVLYILSRRDLLMSQLKLAVAILELPGVNAVEVVDGNGMGEVVYRDWP